MAVYALFDSEPNIDPSAFVHPMATVIGNVRIGAHSTIWPGAVLRGDFGRIEIGEDTSIQDGSVVHATDVLATIVGNRCTVGHIVHLEGCVIEDDALVGSGSVVLHRARVESFAVVGANAVVTNDMRIPSRAMALGVPARIFENRVAPESLADAVVRYVENGRRYREGLRRID
ncbi:MAG: gamma carbonic anhydrase family protein [Actinomycetota bacterium]|nr:gamma carbonic anhydrase family protein [Actinomycetota bacterium]